MSTQKIHDMMRFMKEFTVTKNDAGQRLDRFCAKNATALSSSALQKYFRMKEIKVNGHWQKADYRLSEGESVRMFVPDSAFAAPKSRMGSDSLAAVSDSLDIVYEDENILLVNKKPGVLCHPASGWDPATLVAQIQSHVYRRGEWDPRAENSFAPALANRIDRGTAGIVIAAKNAAALRVLDEKIRAREIDKRYLCVCLGRPNPPQGELRGWLFKDAVKNTVYVRERQEPGAQLAVTRYKLLASANGLSLVECALETGRTHQIRTQMAHMGHPLLGDSKYGDERQNRRWHEKRQLLCSYKLRFDFASDAGILNYLSGQSFAVARVFFAEKYFPDAKV